MKHTQSNCLWPFDEICSIGNSVWNTTKHNVVCKRKSHIGSFVRRLPIPVNGLHFGLKQKRTDDQTNAWNLFWNKLVADAKLDVSNTNQLPKWNRCDYYGMSFGNYAAPNMNSQNNNQQQFKNSGAKNTINTISFFDSWWIRKCGSLSVANRVRVRMHPCTHARTHTNPTTKPMHPLKTSVDHWPMAILLMTARSDKLEFQQFFFCGA